MAEEKMAENKAGGNGKLAVVLVRGTVGITQKVKDTLKMLNLNGKNHCVIVANNDVNKGMLMRVKDYVTWGEIDDSTFKELVAKKGEEYKGRESDSREKYKFKFLKVDGKKYKKYFRLNPPRKGFGRKGIKVQFKAGGALGDRGEKMNDLIMRML